MKKIISIVTIAIPFLLTGCISLSTPHPTSMNFDPNSMEVLGTVEGESKTRLYLLLIPVQVNQNYSSGEAIENAISKVGGDALINAVFDVEWTSFLGIIVERVIRVNGTAIRFKPHVRGQGNPRSPLPTQELRFNGNETKTLDYPSRRSPDGTLIIGPGK